jgi:hypothetical protein
VRDDSLVGAIGPELAKGCDAYFRPAIPSDKSGPPGFQSALVPLATSVIRVVDTVVSNTDPNLQNTDHFNNGETSIAINSVNPNEIVISAFSGSWGNPQPNAPLWHSTNDGQTWTKVFTVPLPPGAAGTGGCPCDQTFDYGQNNVLFGTFLTSVGNFGNIYTGSTTSPTNAASWNWFAPGGNTQQTNQAASALNFADQPWMLHDRGTTNPSSENVFAAYDDFSTQPRGMRVARSINNVPPQFAAGSDPIVGNSTTGGNINPGHRLAADPRNGWVYSLFQNCVTIACNTNPKPIHYMLNRSTDQGTTWTLNGSSTGIVVATANSTQPTRHRQCAARRRVARSGRPHKRGPLLRLRKPRRQRQQSSRNPVHHR